MVSAYLAYITTVNLLPFVSSVYIPFAVFSSGSPTVFYLVGIRGEGTEMHPVLFSLYSLHI